MCDEPALGVSKNFYSWSCEVFSNLSKVNNLRMLEDLDLGENGKHIYSKVAHIALEQKSTW